VRKGSVKTGARILLARQGDGQARHGSGRQKIVEFSLPTAKFPAQLDSQASGPKGLFGSEQGSGAFFFPEFPRAAGNFDASFGPRSRCRRYNESDDGEDG
jgi:hypothetical protein